MNAKLSKLLLALCTVASLGAGAQVIQPDANWGDAQFRQVRAGLTRDEVRSLIGSPTMVLPNARPVGTQWIYTYTDTWGYRTEFDVDFDANGRVTGTDSERLGD